LAHRTGDLVERAHAILRIVEGGDELQVTHIHHELDEQVNEIKRMLNALIKTLTPG